MKAGARSTLSPGRASGYERGVILCWPLSANQSQMRWGPTPLLGDYDLDCLQQNPPDVALKLEDLR
jgi:hypothetical protein